MGLQVAVIGAGPGGLAVAIALHQQGIAVQVYEQVSAFHPSGAILSLMPNGLHALAAIDPQIVATLQAQGRLVSRVRFFGSTGALKGEFPITFQDLFGQPLLLVRWSSLQATLASFLPAAQVHLNHRCVRLTPQEHGVALQFSNDMTVRADLVIGADGLHSMVRQSVLADGPPRYWKRMTWWATLPHGQSVLPFDELLWFVETDRRIVIGNVGADTLCWAAVAREDVLPPTHTADGAAARVGTLFDGWMDTVRDVIAATPVDGIVERPIYDRPPVPTWSTSHVTLLGDAAHPMTPLLGQGANTALEDAYELAQCIAHAPTIATALAQYEQCRIPRTRSIQLRTAFMAMHAYRQEQELASWIPVHEMPEEVTMEQESFEHWLYGYRPTPLTTD